MKGIVIGKLSPTLFPCKTPSWVSVWVRVRVGSNLLWGQGVGKLPGGQFSKYRKVYSSLLMSTDFTKMKLYLRYFFKENI